MKCELCKKNEAQEAIVLEINGCEKELYVCKECAQKEKERSGGIENHLSELFPNAQFSERKKIDLGDMTIEAQAIAPENEMLPPPEFLEALSKAIKNFISPTKDSNKANSDALESDVLKPALETLSVGTLEAMLEEKKRAQEENGKKFKNFAVPNQDDSEPCLFGNYLHLEGLSLIGEIYSVERALSLLDIKLIGVNLDGIEAVGNLYKISYACSLVQVRKAFKEIIWQEKNAREVLRSASSLTFVDAVCRALATLKSCRLLKPGELIDMLSPVRLAAQWNLLKGITSPQIDALMAKVNLSRKGMFMPEQEAERLEQTLADKMNDFFKNVSFVEEDKK